MKTKKCLTLYIFQGIFFMMMFRPGVASAQEIRSLALTRVNGAVIMGWEGTSDTEQDQERMVRDYSENFFRYGLELNLKGYTYHPNLLNFTIDVSLINNQSDIHEFEETSIFNETDNAYDIRLKFLEKKPLHGDLYFYQANTTSGRAFLGRYYNLVKKHGATVYSKLGGIPVVIDANRTKNRYSSLTSEDRNESTDNVTMKTTLYEKDGHRGMLNFRFKDYSESVYGVDYQSTQFQGIFESNFKTTRPTRYNGIFRYDKMSGASDLRTVSLSNSIAHELPKGLRANGMLSFSRTQVFGNKLEQVFAAASLSHSLFESLESEVSLSARSDEGDSTSLNRTTQRLQTAYQKSIPTGRLNISLSQQYEVLANHSNNQTSNGSVQVSFDFSNSVVLTINGIDPGSIVLTNPQMSEFYLEGVDYQILVAEQAVYVTRIPGGNIPAGSDVLISYLFQSQPDYTLSIHEYQDSFQVRFLKFFHIGYRVRGSGNRVSSAFLISPFEEYTARQKMAGLDSKYFSWQYSTEEYDGTRSNYETRSWQGASQITFHRRFRLVYTLASNKTDFQFQNNFNEMESQYLTFSWVLLSGMSGDINYRKLKYNSDNYERSRTSIFARFQCQVRQMLLTGSYEYILDDTDVARRRHSYYILSIRRRF